MTVKNFRNVMRSQAAKLQRSFSDISRAASGESDCVTLETAFSDLHKTASKARVAIELSITKPSEEVEKRRAIEALDILAIAGESGAAGAKHLEAGLEATSLAIEAISSSTAILEEIIRGRKW